jgi:mitogen-activated protein kinase 15
MELTARPSTADVEAIQSSLAATMLESLPPSRTKGFHEMFPSASDEALDMLRRLLQFNPTKRLTIDQALRHPYVAQFHNPDDEPVCQRAIRIPIDDNHKYSIREYRERLYADIAKKKKEIRRRILASRNYYRG